MIPFGYVLRSWESLVHDQLRVGRPVEQPLEMNGVVELLLPPYDFVEAKVVVPLLQRVESDVPVVLAQRMRSGLHIHVEI